MGAVNVRTTGYRDGQLASCPARPNCVCSQSTAVRHAIDPLVVPGGMVNPMGHLLEIVQQLPRVRLLSQEEHYLHLEVRTSWFRFVDDVEFYWDQEASCIHVRSASRIGYSDLGTNRRRIERIRRLFEAT
ncbi:MAG: DUF1499 domain-containing protein [Pirellulaceae bacterium]|nr:DUF1499 domain-containing protein [Pirellulaceae bacterium]